MRRPALLLCPGRPRSAPGFNWADVPHLGHPSAGAPGLRTAQPSRRHRLLRFAFCRRDVGKKKAAPGRVKLRHNGQGDEPVYRGAGG